MLICGVLDHHLRQGGPFLLGVDCHQVTPRSQVEVRDGLAQPLVQGLILGRRPEGGFQHGLQRWLLVGGAVAEAGEGHLGILGIDSGLQHRYLCQGACNKST